MLHIIYKSLNNPINVNMEYNFDQTYYKCVSSAQCGMLQPCAATMKGWLSDKMYTIRNFYTVLSGFQVKHLKHNAKQQNHER